MSKRPGFMMKTQLEVLGFEIEAGTEPIRLCDLKKLFDLFPRCHPHRVYLIMLFACGLRVGEPLELTWANIRPEGYLIFKPKKTKGKITRKVKIPCGVYMELMEYKAQHFFKDGKLFNFNTNSINQRLNKDFRRRLGGVWLDKSENLRGGAIKCFYRYTLRGFRTTAATLLYMYSRNLYGDTQLTLSTVSRWLRHSAYKMTADYYIKRVEALGLHKCPEKSFLCFIDYLIYHEETRHITDYMPCQEHQSIIIEY